MATLQGHLTRYTHDKYLALTRTSDLGSQPDFSEICELAGQ
jgi:hypothetical protein